MTYNCYKPAPTLQPFIDMYWHLSGYVNHNQSITLMPDGSINLIVNLGEDIKSTRFNKSIKHEGVFLVGAMMQTDVQVIVGNVFMFGIKFKPGAFTHFYKFESLDEVANQFLEFSRKDIPDLKKTLQYFVSYIDQFFLDKLSSPRFSVLNIVSDIAQNVDALKVDALAKKHFTTVRQIERQFKQQIGLTPKEFVDLERFNKAFLRVQSRSKQSLADIAWDSGYYDHAHMTNDFKRFTGKAPTAFILSDFSKTIAGEPS